MQFSQVDYSLVYKTETKQVYGWPFGYFQILLWGGSMVPCNIEGKITDCWLVETGAFFLNFLSNEGKITDFWLGKRQKYSHLIG